MPDHVVSGLVRRRAEVAGRIHNLQTELQQLQADLACLDGVIRQFDPDYPLEAIRPKYRKTPDPAEFGAMSRAVLDTLRTRAGPMTTQELADVIIDQRGLNKADRALRRNMVKRVGMALRYQRTNGLVKEVEMEGAEIRWAIKA